VRGRDNRLVTGAEQIRELVGRGTVLMPGVYDALTARIAARVGFDVVFMSGYSVSATRLGEPDFGLVTQTEMADAARSVCRVSEAPVIIDADTGYGNPLNVIRTVHDLQDAGAAGVFLEDQVWPKKCGHMAGKQVVATEDHAAKIRAATDARGERDLFIVARTDARQPLGLDAAIERCLAYREAGADALFVEAPETEAEIEAVAAAFPDVPLVFNWVDGGKTPQLPLERIRELGFALVIYPVTTLFAAARAVADVLDRIGEHDALSFDAFTDMIGLPEMRALEARFAT
jgi:2-methylisocitrate lyase-like PEP mutase family enzyme